MHLVKLGFQSVIWKGKKLSSNLTLATNGIKGFQGKSLRQKRSNEKKEMTKTTCSCFSRLLGKITHINNCEPSLLSTLLFVQPLNFCFVCVTKQGLEDWKGTRPVWTTYCTCKLDKQADNKRRCVQECVHGRRMGSTAFSCVPLNCFRHWTQPNGSSPQSTSARAWYSETALPDWEKVAVNSVARGKAEAGERQLALIEMLHGWRWWCDMRFGKRGMWGACNSPKSPCSLMVPLAGHIPRVICKISHWKILTFVQVVLSFHCDGKKRPFVSWPWPWVRRWIANTLKSNNLFTAKHFSFSPRETTLLKL